MGFMILQAGGEAPVQQGSIMGMLFPFIMMFGVLYLLIIRPQQKQKKEHQKMLDSLEVNDNVVTASGIFGKIVAIKPDKGIVVLRIDEATNTKIEIQKSSISGVLRGE